MKADQRHYSLTNLFLSLLAWVLLCDAEMRSYRAARLREHFKERRASERFFASSRPYFHPPSFPAPVPAEVCLERERLHLRFGPPILGLAILLYLVAPEMTSHENTSPQATRCRLNTADNSSVSSASFSFGTWLHHPSNASS